jgi:UDP-glucuronate 4-epimerase
MKKILITGCAGFIGYNLSKFLLKKKFFVIGVDNIDNYYSVKLKKERIANLKKFKSFKFIKMDLRKKINLKKMNYTFSFIIHFAAQAGVRSSVINPRKTIKNNIDTFLEILEFAKAKNIKNLIYASSSTVYGKNKPPFSEIQKNDTPLSIYGATKIANENMAYVYHNLYNINSFGLRFFTVYGESLRPDMALFKFIKRIKKNEIIDLFNYGKNMRDFTYIDDINLKIFKIMKYMDKQKKNIFEVINLGNGEKISTLETIKIIGKILKINPIIKFSKKLKDDMFITQSSNRKQKNLLKTNKYTKFKDGIKKYIFSK